MSCNSSNKRRKPCHKPTTSSAPAGWHWRCVKKLTAARLKRYCARPLPRSHRWRIASPHCAISTKCWRRRKSRSMKPVMRWHGTSIISMPIRDTGKRADQARCHLQLARKHRVKPDQLTALQQKIEAELAAMDNSEERVLALETSPGATTCHLSGSRRATDRTA